MTHPLPMSIYGITSEQILIRLLVAVFLGSVIGLERGRNERGAGLRTHAMVSLGSCLFMIVSQFGFREVRGIPGIDLDPSRIAAQVVSGIGFLGAGTIIFRKDAVRGLTTAASVWMVALERAGLRIERLTLRSRRLRNLALIDIELEHADPGMVFRCIDGLHAINGVTEVQMLRSTVLGTLGSGKPERAHRTAKPGKAGTHDEAG
jgi:hypothetical protein